MTVQNPKTNWKKQYIEMKAAAESLKEELDKTKQALTEEVQACEDLKASLHAKTTRLNNEEALNQVLRSRITEIKAESVELKDKKIELEKRLDITGSNLKQKTKAVENLQEDLETLFRRFHKIPEFIRWIFGAN